MTYFMIRLIWRRSGQDMVCAIPCNVCVLFWRMMLATMGNVLDLQGNVKCHT
jgi:hypothetical protein